MKKAARPNRSAAASRAVEPKPKPAVRSSERRPFYLIHRVNLALRSIFDAVGKGEGVTLAQYTLLALIASGVYTTSASLARRLQLSPQSVNEMLNALKASGYIETSASPHDRRARILALTDAGEAQLGKAERAMDRAEEACFEGVAPALRKELWSLLQLILERERIIAGGGDDTDAVA